MALGHSSAVYGAHFKAIAPSSVPVIVPYGATVPCTDVVLDFLNAKVQGRMVRVSRERQLRRAAETAADMSVRFFRNW